MRVFIAINLSEPIKAVLINAQNEMYEHGIRGNYTSRENLHLTLAFIGQIPDAEPVLKALSLVSFTTFELCLEGMGCFGDLWWAGMRKSAPLEALARRVRHALAENDSPLTESDFLPISHCSARLTAICQGSGSTELP